MLNFIDGDRLFRDRGFLCELRTGIDSRLYPQYHNFYEIIFVHSGVLNLNLCNRRFVLSRGALAFVRPYDIHSKSARSCAHTNLAFPSGFTDSLFGYLGDTAYRDHLMELPFVPPCQLDEEAAGELEKKLPALNRKGTVSSDTLFKGLLCELIFHYIAPGFASPDSRPDNADTETAVSLPAELPAWFSSSLKTWQQPQHRQEGLDFFCADTGHTKEYICRCFKRYLGSAPTVWLNQQRMNLAVNMMLHSDRQVTEIAYASGFGSLSRFYHTFKATYGMSPKQFLARELGVRK